MSILIIFLHRHSLWKTCSAKEHMPAQLCGWINWKGLPPCSLTKLKRACETLTSQKGNLLYTKWHDKRDVNILSTNIDPLTPPVVKERRKKNGEVEEVEKPYCIEQYNKYMEYKYMEYNKYVELMIIQLLPLISQVV